MSENGKIDWTFLTWGINQSIHLKYSSFFWQLDLFVTSSPSIYPTQFRIHTRARSLKFFCHKATKHYCACIEQSREGKWERERVEVLFLDGHCVVILLTPHLSFDLSQLDKQNLSICPVSTCWCPQSGMNRKTLSQRVCVHWKIIPISRLAARPGLPFQIINWLFQFTVTMVTSSGCQSPGNHKYYLVSGSSVDPDKTRAASLPTIKKGNYIWICVGWRNIFLLIQPFRV